ncbi:MAG TPA: sugar ABC transporter substrate-binding protein [Solibacterales bacterium]|nr:sugar ABC transporter substrate-binding protein [Bryobacterales bacterium]
MRVTAALLTTAALLGLSACSKERHSPAEQYYLVTANKKLLYWKGAAAGLADVAKQLGVQAEMVGPDNYAPQEEVAAFRRAVAKNPAGILVSAADPNLLKDEIDAAIAKGIPVVTMDADTPGSKRLTFIGTNNYQAGQMGGRVAVKALSGKGNVVFYTMPGQANLDERLDGYKSILAESPGIKIQQVVDVKGDPRIAFDTTKELIAKEPSPDAFVCLEASSCEEVADVLTRENKTGKVVIAMDTDAGTLEWIKKGAIVATIAQKPYSMAFYGVKVLADLHYYKPSPLGQDWSRISRAPVPHFIDTGATLVDKSNVEQFIQAANGQ